MTSLWRITRKSILLMSRADVEDISRSMVDSQRRQYLARASTYRFKGISAGSSFHDQFSIKEAKEA